MKIKVARTDKIHYLDHTNMVGKKHFTKFKVGLLVNGRFYQKEYIANWDEAIEWIKERSK